MGKVVCLNSVFLLKDVLFYSLFSKVKGTWNSVSGIFPENNSTGICVY